MNIDHEKEEQSNNEEKHTIVGSIEGQGCVKAKRDVSGNNLLSKRIASGR